MTHITFKAQLSPDVSKTTTACLVIPVFAAKKLNQTAMDADQLSSGAISAALKLGDFSAKAGQTLLLPGAGKAKRIILIGCGEENKFDREAARKLTRSVYRAVGATQAKDALLQTADLVLEDTLPAADLPLPEADDKIVKILSLTKNQTTTISFFFRASFC